MNYTKWLNETNISDINLTGGKCSSLGQMISNLDSLNIKIPYGFVVTSNAYDYFMEHNKLLNQIEHIINNTNIEDNIQLKRDSLKIRNMIINGEFPKDLKIEISNEYQKLSNMYLDNNGQKQEYTDVAVRSSGISEDMPDASFAGQQDTYLNVRGNSMLLSKIKSCFASLYNDRAICYRKSMNYTNNNIKIAVCIQKMIRSDLGSSGVAFSIDTESGNNNIILINGSWGLGEMVVSGQVKPDEFLVFKPALERGYKAIIDKKLGDKTHKMVYSDDSDKRTKIIHLENYKKNKFCLDDIKLIQLAKWVNNIDKYYSNLHGKWTPMDIEWALDGLTNELYIVQARPETIHSRKNNYELTEYVLSPNQNINVILKGIAVGNSISSGKVKIMYSLDTRENDVEFNEGDVLVTEITDPDWEPLMKKASAIITNKGGRTCHSAIVARELGITAIVGTGNCTEILLNNQLITTSCAEGDIGFVYNGKLDYQVIKTNLNDLPNIKTKLMLNVASPDQALNFAKLPNHGVGLARLEFIINNFIQVHPNALVNYDKINNPEIKKKISDLVAGFDNPKNYYVKKLSFGIAKIASGFYPNPVIVRFSDFKSNEYANLLGGKDYEPNEENPMLGFRGASRYYDQKFRKAFGLECEAIKYVRNIMGLDNVIVMLPFVRTITECKKVLDVMKEFGLERGINGLQVYLMCEIPSNVILVDEFSKLVDGYSIGSNDLTQLTLGCDRDNEMITHIYDERNEAVKKMISLAIQGCKRNGIKSGICGQAPSDYPEFAEFLIKEGIDTISLTPDSILKTIKNLAILEKTL